MAAKSPEELSTQELARLLGRLMLAWDGQWFLKTAEALGLEQAVALNARVRASFGRIEMREFLRALGKTRADTLEEAVSLIEAYARSVFVEIPNFSHAPGGEGFDATVAVCQPQAGAGKAGLRPDTPCVACQKLWGVWLGALLPGSSWEAEIAESLGRGAPRCLIRVRPSGDGPR